MLRYTWIDSHIIVFFVVVVNKEIYFEVIQLNSFSPKYLASDGGNGNFVEVDENTDDGDGEENTNLCEQIWE